MTCVHNINYDIVIVLYFQIYLDGNYLQVNFHNSFFSCDIFAWFIFIQQQRETFARYCVRKQFISS